MTNSIRFVNNEQVRQTLVQIILSQIGMETLA
jgi:hypothetical protein